MKYRQEMDLQDVTFIHNESSKNWPVIKTVEIFPSSLAEFSKVRRSWKYNSRIQSQAAECLGCTILTEEVFESLYEIEVRRNGLKVIFLFQI